MEKWGKWRTMGGNGGDWGGGGWGNSSHSTRDMGCGGLWQEVVERNGRKTGEKWVETPIFHKCHLGSPGGLSKGSVVGLGAAYACRLSRHRRPHPQSSGSGNCDGNARCYRPYARCHTHLPGGRSRGGDTDGNEGPGPLHRGNVPNARLEQHDWYFAAGQHCHLLGVAHRGPCRLHHVRVHDAHCRETISTEERRPGRC